MTELTTDAPEDGVCAITLNDGKANVLSPNMLGQIDRQLDRAVAYDAVVISSVRDRGRWELDGFRGLPARFPATLQPWQRSARARGGGE